MSMNFDWSLLIPHEPSCIGALATAAAFLVVGIVIIVRAQRRNRPMRNEFNRRTHIFRP